MNTRMTGRPFSARHSHPLTLTPEAEASLRLDGVIIDHRDEEDDVAGFAVRLPERPGRDGLDFRDPGYLSPL